MTAVVAAAPLGLDTSRLATMPPRKLGREFEALLLAQLVGEMRKTVPDSGLLSASPARRMLDGAFDMEMARAMATTSPLGIGDQIARQIERQRKPEAVEASAYALPVNGAVTSRFGVRIDPITGDERFHGGIDLAAPAGTPIRAAADGEVVFSGRRGASGNLVEVRHADGLVTSYAHAARTLVAAGQKVAAGDILATVGSTGRSTGPHLHFTVEKHGQPVDPSAFLERERHESIALPLKPARGSADM